MIRNFFTWRLNFYRFKWWRKWWGYPEPRPWTAFEHELVGYTLDALGRMCANSVNRDYETGACVNIRRPTPFKADQKDRYL